MGIPMPQIHSPTTAAASSSTTPEIGADLDNLTLQQLIRQKDSVEAELSALGSVLDSHNVRMTTSLTTLDGYPRSDIDVAQVRTTRARIIRLRNDHKAVMSRIEKGLHGWFAEQRDMPPTPLPTTSRTAAASSSAAADGATALLQGAASSTSQRPQAGPPFALVNTIAPNSPASSAGLLPGDKIQVFGEADYFNNEKLALVARVVGRSEGQSLNVVVLRHREGEGGAEEQVRLTLVPRSGWGGRGLLGCHLLPL